MNTSANLPVKMLDDFTQDESAAPLLQRMSFWLALIVIFAIILTALLGLAAQQVIPSTSDWVTLSAVAFFGASILSGSRVVDIMLEQQAKRGVAYGQHLASIDIETLIFAINSPEYDEASKDAIIKHLAARQPGWSWANAKGLQAKKA